MKLYKGEYGYYVLSKSGKVLRNITAGRNVEMQGIPASLIVSMLSLALIGNNYKGRTV